MNYALKEAIKNAVTIYQAQRIRQATVLAMPYPQQFNLQKTIGKGETIIWKARFFCNEVSDCADSIRFYSDDDARNLFIDFLNNKPNMNAWVTEIEEGWLEQWTDHLQENVFWYVPNRPGR